ncbi:neutral zinc metallopeptidase [Pseudonocardia sp. TRM90224]|uniref:neutral zinc metallopeptidase n=1 Tax=Pseudonocardia sp. TRM90224 TaxID=2812678 RepID=UPI001E541BF6|nr:neutral zinc metallopeptidase [Pseudonocardia sp. TRM90224]
MSASGRLVSLVSIVLASALVTGCAETFDTRQVPDGQGAATSMAASVATSVAAAQSVPPEDAAASAAVEELQRFWRSAFPASFGREWDDIAVFAPVRADAQHAPCATRAGAISGQAYYCPAADAVVWDAEELVPSLHERFGPAGVAVVLAHEVGHAVQTRLGVDAAQVAQPERYPTILLEAMADCYAGVALAHLAANPVTGLPFGVAERDRAVLALVGFRDPVGVDAGDRSAHGNALDRVSALQDGYAADPRVCATMSLDNRTFTQRRFTSGADQARGGDLPVPALLAAVEEDARRWFTAVGSTRAPEWRAPALRRRPTAACDTTALAAQGPARFCERDGSVSVDLTEVTSVHRRMGDYAGGVLVASRYALATATAAGARADGTTAVCLAGAYTSRLIDLEESFALSPGDLDEAVQVLLAVDWAARDAHGAVDPADHGYERVAHFRLGLQGGPDACFR